MADRIEIDQRRFRRIVRGQIKKHLRKFISKGQLIAPKGKKKVAVPLPEIQIPKFRYGERNTGGVGQGEGEEGDVIGRGQPGPGQGREAGDQPGEHALEVEFTVEELAEILGEELELPRIQPKGVHRIETIKDKYSGIRQTGPESLRHFKRTFKRALKRQLASGTYDPDAPIIIPIREDKRYRSWKTETVPQSNAVIFYIMDVSGSMGEEQKEIVRIESYWIDVWLQTQYKGLETRYIIHDAQAREVDRETFFRTKESGGTIISSAYKVCLEILERDYPAGQWNVYVFQFSDGDNWSGDDTKLCMDLLEERIFPQVNLFCYGQVRSPYGSGQFLKDLRGRFGDDHDVLITSEIPNRDAIVDSIKDFLGKGK